MSKQPPPPVFMPPLKPHRGLFVILFVIALLWTAFLVTEYFKTVRGKASEPALPSTESAN